MSKETYSPKEVDLALQTYLNILGIINYQEEKDRQLDESDQTAKERLTLVFNKLLLPALLYFASIESKQVDAWIKQLREEDREMIEFGLKVKTIFDAIK